VNALQNIERELRRLGYSSEALIHDYTFADVLSISGEERHVELAAFTQMPESYRSAAFAVISGTSDVSAIVGRRALGAPILFVIGQSDVGVWRVGAQGAPRLLERVSLDALPELFQRNAERWRPQAVHRAKSLAQSQVAYQLDFVDLGLIPAIEHEVEDKLDRLLKRVIDQLLKGLDGEREEAAFRTTFRLLAAKILVDREHPDALSWAVAPVGEVLAGIEAYYNLGQLSTFASASVPSESVAAAWLLLREGISFRNISSDSLAFVYENTLVTADTRKRFGTHSTPRQVAEYVVGRLDLSRFDLDKLTIFEPFTGAGTFLVAALRAVRDLLPEGMTGKQRHAFLVGCIKGAEIDAFACEVATLSLILADYPNANGWKIKAEDLFLPMVLAEETATATVVLCNPPWEDFDANERVEYPEMATKSISRPMTVLRTVLEMRPDAIGFVLPQGFLRQQQYADLRQQVADTYGRVELTSLPDRVFQRAGFQAAVLVASELRDVFAIGSSKLLSAVVEDRDRVSFLTTGEISAKRRRTKIVRTGDIWIGALDELWEHLERYPRLDYVANVYRGLKWWKQATGRSAVPRDGFAPGVFDPSASLLPFEIRNVAYLDLDPKHAMFPGPLTRPWDTPKILANSARRSRGPWRIAAAYDLSGLVASQAFFGIWLRDENVPGEALEAILNGPLANAFLTERASNQHFTNQLLKQLPMPKHRSLGDIAEAVRRYRAAKVAIRKDALEPSGTDAVLNTLLIEIDAEVLKAYDLPPRLERRLLDFFRGHEDERRVGHEFRGWFPADFTAYIPLHEYLGPLVEQNRGPWALDIFTPAPDEEVAALKKYVR
jgi:N-6 DNA Methylase